jgi:transposase
MPIVGGLDIHRRQITFDYLDTVTGQVCRGQVAPADREHLRAWLARFAGRDDVAFAVEGCAGWRYVAEELAAAGITAHLAEPADTAARRGRKRHAKTDKTDARHLRMLLAEGRLPECWIPPARILECRALLELYNDLRRERTAWAQRIHAVLFHQGAPRLGEGVPPRCNRAHGMLRCLSLRDDDRISADERIRRVTRHEPEKVGAVGRAA